MSAIQEAKEMYGKIFLCDPDLAPMFGRNRRFSHAESMEWLISGRPEEPERISGFCDRMPDRSRIDWTEESKDGRGE